MQSAAATVPQDTRTLRDIVREVYEQSDNPNRYELIDEIIDQIRPVDRPEMMRQMLRQLTPYFSGEFRRQAMNAKPEGPVSVSRIREERADFDGTTDAIDDYVPQAVLTTDTGSIATTDKPKVGVPRRNAYAAIWAQFTRQTIPTKDGTQIFIRDATVDDLVYQATQRLDKADALSVEAQKWQNAADALKESGAHTVGEAENVEGFRAVAESLTLRP